MDVAFYKFLWIIMIIFCRYKATEIPINYFKMSVNLVLILVIVYSKDAEYFINTLFHNT